MGGLTMHGDAAEPAGAQLSAAFAGRPTGRSGVVVDLLRPLEPTSVLDFGCGNGGLIAWLRDEWRVDAHACDIDTRALEDLRARRKDINLYRVDDSSPSLPLADGSLSAVVMADVFEHIPGSTRPVVLRELNRVLAPGGGLVITVPHRGLFHWADPENVKFRWPRLHRAIYRRLVGADQYERFYGSSDGFGNYSTGALEHKHFTVSELRSELAGADFALDHVEHFRLLNPFLRVLLWTAEGIRNRIGMPRVAMQTLWKLYAWDAELRPRRFSDAVGVLGVKRAAAGSRI